jgi:hypothetical protein
MKPKEKAEELVRKYYTFGINKEGQTLSWYECKQCALIAVDEIIQILPTSEYLEDVGNTIENRQRTYWNQVKQEIKNL